MYQQLRHVKVIVGKLNVEYERTKNLVAAAHAQTLPVLSETVHILEEKERIETRQAVLSSFKSHFIMSEDEIAFLTSTAEPIDDQFFHSLATAKQINHDCQLLLGFEKQNLGLELMDQTSRNINFAFQKLYKWVQRELKSLDLENPQLSSSIRRALRILAERPSLFQNCLEFFAVARERNLSESFLSALTGNVSHGPEDPTIKPIDLTAHDPIRYAGDMLAWVHSAAVSEREALEVMFVAEGEELSRGLKAGRQAEMWQLVDEEDQEAADFDASKALHNLIDQDLSGVARVLRQRIEQVIQANEDVISAYKLIALINFYHVTFRKLLGVHSNLLECVVTLESEALRQFRALIRDHIATLQAEFHRTPQDIGPPAFLQTSFQQLGVILRTYESSLSTSQEREFEFETVLMEAFEPYMAACESIARSMEAPEDTIFLINCKLSAIKCLELFESTRLRARELVNAISQVTPKLVNSQHAFFRQKSGLVELLAQAENGAFMQNGVESIDEKALSLASRELDGFLPSALLDAMDRLGDLQDANLAREITEEASHRFCADFELLEQTLDKIDGSAGKIRVSDNVRLLFPRTVAEVRVLLS